MWKTIHRITNKKSKTTNITKIVVDDKVIEEPEVIVNTFNNFSIKLEQLWLKNYQKVQGHLSHILNLKLTPHSNYKM
jgi:hypothetical protein